MHLQGFMVCSVMGENIARICRSIISPNKFSHYPSNITAILNLVSVENCSLLNHVFRKGDDEKENLILLRADLSDDAACCLWRSSASRPSHRECGSRRNPAKGWHDDY